MSELQLLICLIVGFIGVVFVGLMIYESRKRNPLPVQKVCPHCEYTYDTFAKFCPHCGKDVGLR
jgi:predicted amidophosphoribosyltransferase